MIHNSPAALKPKKKKKKKKKKKELQRFYEVGETPTITSHGATRDCLIACGRLVRINKAFNGSSASVVQPRT